MTEANAKGEVSITLEEGQDPYVLSFTFDDIADADDLAQRSIMREFAQGDFRQSTLRILFYVGARPDSRLQTPQQVRGKITMANFGRVSDAVIAAYNAAFPNVESQAGGGEDPT